MGCSNLDSMIQVTGYLLIPRIWALPGYSEIGKPILQLAFYAVGFYGEMGFEPVGKSIVKFGGVSIDSIGMEN